MIIRLVACVFILFAVAASGVQAEEMKAGAVAVEKPWSRASLSTSRSGAAYMTLVAKGDKADRLIGLSSSVAERTEIHTHIVENNIMKMRQLSAIDVTPGSPTVFKPGGLHVMLMGLKKPLKEGDSFQLTLTFEHSGTVTVDVPVQKMSSMKPMEHHEHHKMDHGPAEKSGS